jgi:hypothetical protein
MLKIIFNSTDISREQSRFSYLASSLAFTGSNSILVGFKKPLSSLFFNVAINSGTRTLAVQYFNGTTYASVPGLNDLTYGLTRAGFITFNERTDEALTTESGTELYWYKFTLSEAATVSVSGIGVVFSDDEDLKGEYPSIMDFLPSGAETFIRFHESARKAIVKDLRKNGIKTLATGATTPGLLTEYDILDKEEVREASKFLALSKVFRWLSDSTGDNWDGLSKEYGAEAAGAISPLISIDSDDDGKTDDEEKLDNTGLVIVGRQ